VARAARELVLVEAESTSRGVQRRLLLLLQNLLLLLVFPHASIEATLVASLND
jgi:hypothetical protein